MSIKNRQTVILLMHHMQLQKLKHISRTGRKWSKKLVENGRIAARLVESGRKRAFVETSRKRSALLPWQP